MGEIKQSTAGYNIIGSGSTFTFKEEPLMIEIANPKLVIQFNFVEEKEKGNKIEGTPATGEKGDQYLKISIYNTSGTGIIDEPLFIAQDDTTHKKSFLSIAFQKHM